MSLALSGSLASTASNHRTIPMSQQPASAQRPASRSFSTSTGGVTWIPDSLAVLCFSCKSGFSLWNRRHHCRRCGYVFCNSCSNKRIRLSYGEDHLHPVRVCDTCYSLIDDRNKRFDRDKERQKEREKERERFRGSRSGCVVQRTSSSVCKDNECRECVRLSQSDGDEGADEHLEQMSQLRSPGLKSRNKTSMTTSPRVEIRQRSTESMSSSGGDGDVVLVPRHVHFLPGEEVKVPVADVIAVGPPFNCHRRRVNLWLTNFQIIVEDVNLESSDYSNSGVGNNNNIDADNDDESTDDDSFADNPSSASISSPATSVPGFVCIPMGNLYKVEKEAKEEIGIVDIQCKDFTSIRLIFEGLVERQLYEAFEQVGQCVEHYAFSKPIVELFAFSNKESKLSTPVSSSLTSPGSGWTVYDPCAEYKRIGVPSGSWRLYKGNSNYSICPSYPALLAVPLSLTDAEVAATAKFRSSGRFPVLTWKDRGDGPAILRSAQPSVGTLTRRCAEDEKLVHAIALSNPVAAVTIVDARHKQHAMMNRAIGYGHEDPENYTLNYKAGELRGGGSTLIEFMGMENIHKVRKSFWALCKLCSSDEKHDLQWMSNLAATRWPEYVSAAIGSAARIVHLMVVEGRSILVHCSDGWDRTSQLCGLAQILLDPYYRTLSGFQVLIEKDWCSFGHRFGDRLGHGEGLRKLPNEFSPIFVQWIDSVWQLSQQFPRAFEFNEKFLITILDHAYSCRFGTFLCNNERERVVWSVKEMSESLWTYVNAPCRVDQYVNPHFVQNPDYRESNSKRVATQVLIPNSTTSIRLWTGYYLRWHRGHPKEDLAENLRLQMDLLLSSLRTLEATSAVDKIIDQAVYMAEVSALKREGQREADRVAKEHAWLEASNAVEYIIGRSMETIARGLEHSLLNQKLEVNNLTHRMADSYFGNVMRMSPNRALSPNWKASPSPSSRRLNEDGDDTDTDTRSTSLSCSMDNNSNDSPQRNPGHHNKIIDNIGMSSRDVFEASQEQYARPRWVPDELAPACKLCSHSFGFLTRRHHCRACGDVFCNPCSAKTLVIPSSGKNEKVRVCDGCYVLLVAPGMLDNASDTASTPSVSPLKQH